AGNGSVGGRGGFMDGELLAVNGTARSYELCGALTQARFEPFPAALPCTRFSLVSQFSRLGSSHLDTPSKIALMRARLTPKKASCFRFCRIAWRRFRRPRLFLMIPRNSKSTPITEGERLSKRPRRSN